MKETKQAVATTTRTIHQQLQEIATRELKQLPEPLEQLAPLERVRVIMQLLPYTAPKVETCRTNFGEPPTWEL